MGGLKRRPEAKGVLAGMAADYEDIVFAVSWRGGRAALIELVDNERGVSIAEPEGRNGVAVRYLAPRASSHRIRWHLLAPQELTDLVARARRDGEEWKELAKSEKVAHRWKGKGTLR